ncbi:MAG TPA: Uma2 family endonuclease [Desulfobacter sp.]|jgi:Uma2 family endonuclease|nr:Uma2 family endonuclease [Desulfobacter sp.]
MTAKPQEQMTPAEYLELERSSLDIKHEFFNGEIFAMVGAGRNHVRINANLARKIGNKFEADNSPCEVWPNDMRVKIATGYVYPDIAISCGDPEFEDNEFDTLTNPVVIIEVLSSSTEAFDRGKKFTYYQDIPTLQEYILVSPDEYLIEKFIRRENKWEYYSYKSKDQNLKIESVDHELLISEIYYNVNFEIKASNRISSLLD